MKIIKKEVPDNFNLFLFGDAHLGSVLFYRKGFKKFLDMVSSKIDGIPVKHNYCIDHSDCIEAIKVDDPRYDPDTCENPFPLEQSNQYISLISEISSNLVCLLYSNHFYTLHRYGNLAKYIVEQLQQKYKSPIEYGTFTCKVLWTDKSGKIIFKSFHTHGRKTINSTADDPKRRRTNMELILKRHLKFKMGDCVLMCKGHTHKLIVCKPAKELFIFDRGNKLDQDYTSVVQTAQYIHPDLRYYVNTGAFYKIYGENISSYAEIAEYDPIVQGFVLAKIRDKKLVSIEEVEV